jgi:hypothetical protein
MKPAKGYVEIDINRQLPQTDFSALSPKKIRHFCRAWTTAQGCG